VVIKGKRQKAKGKREKGKGKGKREKGKRLRPERGAGGKRAQRAAERERVGVGPHAH